MDRLTNTRDTSNARKPDDIKDDSTTATAKANREQAAEKGAVIVPEEKSKDGTDGGAKPDSEDDADTSGGVLLEDAHKKIAVILKLPLGSSQYATMALRELMKADGVKTYKPDFGGGR